MFDALEFDDVDEEYDEAKNTEAHGQRYTGIFQHVHALVGVNTCIRPHTLYVLVTNNNSSSNNNHHYPVHLQIRVD